MRSICHGLEVNYTTERFWPNSVKWTLFLWFDVAQTKVNWKQLVISTRRSLWFLLSLEIKTKSQPRKHFLFCKQTELLLETQIKCLCDLLTRLGDHQTNCLTIFCSKFVCFHVCDLPPPAIDWTKSTVGGTTVCHSDDLEFPLAPVRFVYCPALSRKVMTCVSWVVVVFLNPQTAASVAYFPNCPQFVR